MLAASFRSTWTCRNGVAGNPNAGAPDIADPWAISNFLRRAAPPIDDRWSDFPPDDGGRNAEKRKRRRVTSGFNTGCCTARRGRRLSTEARALYVQLAMRYIGVNNGRISYSVREGADGVLHVGKSTTNRALADLVDRGFIVVDQARRLHSSSTSTRPNGG